MDKRNPISKPTDPSPRVLAWVRDALGGGETVVDVVPLTGGISSAIHRLKVRTARGTQRDVVLKRFVDRQWVAREPDLATREVTALEIVCELGVPAPRALACDPDGERCGDPALIMSFVPGIPELPRSPDNAWLEKLASPLPALHAAGELVATGLPSYRAYTSVGDLDPPFWSRDPGAWQRAFEILSDPPTSRRSLIHRDYHPCNLLWSQGEILGVADWTMACCGPVAIDTAHCRMNLVCLYSVDVADTFESAYRERGGPGHQPFWDLRCAVDMLPLDRSYPGWGDLGRDDLRLDEIRERIDRWVSMLVAEFAG